MKTKSVLVVEDEYFVAGEMADAVRAAGHVVIGPVGGAKEALDLIASTRIDCAILDLHIDGALSLEIGSVLDQANIPFAIASGYDCEVLEGAFETSPYFVKPVRPDLVVSAIVEA